MTPFQMPQGFRPDRKLTDVLKDASFTFSAEIIPPRNGTEQVKVLTQVNQLVEAGAQFLAVTKGAGGSLRGGSLPIAQAIKEAFSRPVIAHFTCRDLTPQDVENQLIDHAYFGIRNILALRGDPPQGQPEWKAREGGYSFAYQLIEQIHNLNQGRFLTRPSGPEADAQTPTDFCIGAAAYPEFPDEKARIDYFELKVKAGAEYGITDMLFDPEAYARFVDALSRRGIRIPILPGTRLLKSRAQAQKMMERFKVSVPQATLDALPTEATDSQAGIDQLVRCAERLKQLGAPGLHLYVIADTSGAAEALSRLTG